MITICQSRMRLIFFVTFIDAFLLRNACFSQNLDSSAVMLKAKIYAVAISGQSYAENEKELGRLLAVTNISFLQNEGFDKVAFIKVKLRNRYLLEHFLFLETLNEEERIAYNSNPNKDAFDSLKRVRLYSAFKIDEFTTNNVLEKYLPDKSNYYDFKEANMDIYLAYYADSFYLLNEKKYGLNLKDLHKHALKGTILNYKNKSLLEDLRITNGKLPKEILNSLKIKEVPLRNW